jgi:hypothetical protein
MGPADRTRALVAPAALTVDADRRRELEGRLTDVVAGAAARLGPGHRVALTLPMIRRARRDPGSVSQPDQPFAWRPSYVRRSLGLAAVEACVAGRFRTPAEAVGPVADRAVAHWRRTGWRTHHWEPWLDGLGTGARALVLAEAVTWATTVWTSFDWDGFPAPPRVGGTDDRWACRAAPGVQLRGRAELRVAVTTSGPGTRGTTTPGAGPQALVSVTGGCPTDGWADELAYLALVAGLRPGADTVPVRVLGLWPDTGILRTVEIGAATLDRAVDLVATTLGAMVGAGIPTSAAA